MGLLWKDQSNTWQVSAGVVSNTPNLGSELITNGDFETLGTNGGTVSGVPVATRARAANVATLTHTPNPMQFLNRVCGRPASEKPVMIVVAGHAAPDATVPLHALRKKPLEQITTWL